MFLLYYFLLLSLFFYVLKLLKRNVEYGIIFGLVRFEKGIGLIDKLIGRWTKYFETLSYYIGNLIIVISVFLLIYGIIKLKAMFSPLIPGIKVQGIYIPIFPTLIAIFFVALIHELAHAVIIRYYGLRLKSWGILFFGPFLGAFVEPDEKEIKKLEPKKQISIYNAGAVANIITGIIFLLLSFIAGSIYSNTFQLSNVTVTKVVKNSPAYLAGLAPGETILFIDNNKITSIKDIREALKNKKPGDIIVLITDKGNYSIKLENKNGKPYIGIFIKQNYIIKDQMLFNLLSFILSLLNWLFVISIGIGIANLLPIYPLDGGRSIKTLLQWKFGEKGEIYSKYISISALVLLLINISFSFIL